jgi:hypothetical protein
MGGPPPPPTTTTQPTPSTGKQLREGFNKEKHFFYGIFHKKHFFKNILKDAQKLLIHPEM